MNTSSERIWRHMEFLAGQPRAAHSAALERCREYCHLHLEKAGWIVEERPFEAVAEGGEKLSGVNLVARCAVVDRILKARKSPPTRREPHAGPPLFVLGAHLDTKENTPGADDNASGVAALLEIGTVLPMLLNAENAIAVIPEIVVFDLEEWGMLGGTFHAQACRQADLALAGMISLEMIGYCDTAPNSQQLPPELEGFYPTTGDFIGVVGNQYSGHVIERFAASLNSVHDLSAHALQVPNDGHDFRASRLSDHSPFWDAGYPALMLTDTSFLRNPHYHQPTDTPETLDREFLHQVTEGTLIGLLESVLHGVG